MLREGLLSSVQPGGLNYSAVFSDSQLPEEFRGRELVVDGFGDFLPAHSPLYFINSASGGRWTKVELCMVFVVSLYFIWCSL